MSAADARFARAPRGTETLEESIEFSFGAGAPLVPVRSGYTIDVSSLDRQEVEGIVETGLRLLGEGAKSTTSGGTSRRLDTLFDQDGRRLLYGVGAEHAADGAISRLKTYWRFPSPLAELRRLLSGQERDKLDEFMRAASGSWPRWKDAKLVGIDYPAAGRTKFKAYLPQKDFAEPLSLVSFSTFLLSLGWRVCLDAFPLIAYLLLDGQDQVVPTAYSVGIAMGDAPATKLEIAAKAYFRELEPALSAVSRLAEALSLDPSPLQTGVAGLQKHTPLGRPPVIEVICVEFLPNGATRVVVYCRL